MAGMKAESGLQLLARLSSRPNVSNLCSRLFPPGTLNPMDIVQILGQTGTGKTVLMTELLARCILSSEYGGMEAGAILVNTDHHFQLKRLVETLKHILLQGKCQNISQEIKSSLQRLTLLPCFDGSQLRINLITLPQYLAARTQVSLIAFDSPISFYGRDCLLAEKQHVSSKYKYLQNIITTLLSPGVSQQHVILVYTVPDAFISSTCHFKPPTRHPTSTLHTITQNCEDININSECRTVFTSSIRRSNSTEIGNAVFIVTNEGVQWLENSIRQETT